MRRKINKKKTFKFILIGLIAYSLLISFTAVIYLDTANNLKIDRYDGIIIPVDGNGNGNQTDNETEIGGDIFDAQAILMSNIERGSKYNLHLFALPSQKAELYRDFSIVIYSSQPANYLIKMDNQTHSSGSFQWMKRIDMHSDYDKMDISVILENNSQVSREFSFKNIALLDSPWQADTGGGGGGKADDDDDIPAIIEPYIKMSQGELSVFVAKRVFCDIAAVILGILFGVQMAAIRVDLKGIERAM